MKRKLLKRSIITLKGSFYGVVIQTIFFTAIQAREIHAPKIESVREVISQRNGRPTGRKSGSLTLSSDARLIPAGKPPEGPGYGTTAGRRLMIRVQKRFLLNILRSELLVVFPRMQPFRMRGILSIH
ncbi:MAG: hypothetical protein MI975_09180 [Cytophagales bacterium]|nr:hypothetical protein [Cytophagales bacterium]